MNKFNDNMNKFYCIIKNIIWSMNIKYAFIIFYDIEWSFLIIKLINKCEYLNSIWKNYLWFIVMTIIHYK